MHTHRQPDAFDYCYLQRRPELSMSQFGNLFLSTEFCVFLHQNLFPLCLRMSSCIFRLCHSSINTTCRMYLEWVNSPVGHLWLPQCIFVVADPKACIPLSVWHFVTILLRTNYYTFSLWDLYFFFTFLTEIIFQSTLWVLPQETKQSKTKEQAIDEYQYKSLLSTWR